MSPIAAITLSSVPAAAMLLFTLAGLNTEVSPSIAGALQHFAAGVLLCTVGTELLPAMVDAEGWHENAAAFIGFFSGVAVLIALGVILPETAELDIANDDDDVEQVDGQEDEEEDAMILRSSCFSRTDCSTLVVVVTINNASSNMQERFNIGSANFDKDGSVPCAGGIVFNIQSGRCSDGS